jgi:hypothetical protein
MIRASSRSHAGEQPTSAGPAVPSTSGAGVPSCSTGTHEVVPLAFLRPTEDRSAGPIYDSYKEHLFNKRKPLAGC